MISIIICLSNCIKLETIKRNIESTIGVKYELIIIDNSTSKYNIFQAYNIGVKRSQFPILCFMHDDIIYNSSEWGQEVVRHFDPPSTGIIGVGGSRFLSSIPTIWWAGAHKYLKCLSGTVCQNTIDTDKNNPEIRRFNLINPEQSIYTRVAVLDGLWFCIRKSLFDIISFDENLYQGFHFYDLDISMQVNRLKYNALCVFNIQIEHISSSKHDRKWIESCELFYGKWKHELPLSFVDISLSQLLYIEYKAFKLLRDIYGQNNLKFSLYRMIKTISFWNLISFHIKTISKR